VCLWEHIWRIRNNTELDHLISGAYIVRFNKAQRIKWLGHVQRMDTSRTAKNIWMQNYGKPTTGKTETEMVGRCVWRPKGAESEKLEGISNGQENLEWLVWESQNPQMVVVLMEEGEVSVRTDPSGSDSSKSIIGNSQPTLGTAVCSHFPVSPCLLADTLR
jgi:hypothetical protein